MVGESDRLQAVYQLLSRIAPVNVPALILGETGTGKELAAKELHRLSGRSQAPFIIVNATALPESLIESELFGHKRGAFTGALSDRIGLIEQADGGTLFIDEIGELSTFMQTKLLRVLQEKTFTRVGDATLKTSHFRLVAATHRNLQEMIASGLFREDLYYRIAGAIIAMPPLRDRRSDIMILATFFRTRFANNHGMADKHWSPSAVETLENLMWPGNVRELANVVARAFVMSDGPMIHAKDLLDVAAVDTPTPAAAATFDTAHEHQSTLEEARDAWMKRFLTKALDRHNGRRTDTAKALGIGERTLFRYIEQLDIS
jgi:DNA-binding NtrC family response regulator